MFVSRRRGAVITTPFKIAQVPGKLLIGKN
jgi:hypothetical protein